MPTNYLYSFSDKSAHWSFSVNFGYLMYDLISFDFEISLLFKPSLLYAQNIYLYLDKCLLNGILFCYLSLVFYEWSSIQCGNYDITTLSSMCLLRFYKGENLINLLIALYFMNYIYELRMNVCIIVLIITSTIVVVIVVVVVVWLI